MNIEFIVASMYFQPCGPQKGGIVSNKRADTAYILGSQYTYFPAHKTHYSPRKNVT
jgi:hypothetical protein